MSSAHPTPRAFESSGFFLDATSSVFIALFPASKQHQHPPTPAAALHALTVFRAEIDWKAHI